MNEMVGLIMWEAVRAAMLTFLTAALLAGSASLLKMAWDFVMFFSVSNNNFGLSFN